MQWWYRPEGRGGEALASQDAGTLTLRHVARDSLVADLVADLHPKEGFASRAYHRATNYYH